MDTPKSLTEWCFLEGLFALQSSCEELSRKNPGLKKEKKKQMEAEPSSWVNIFCTKHHLQN